MKFAEIPYVRPDAQAVKEEYVRLTDALKKASSYAEAKAVLEEKDVCYRHFMTAQCLAYIRHSVDTRDAFYDEEEKFFNNVTPELMEYDQNFTLALLASPFRAEFTRDFGEILFKNAEMELKAFSPDIIAEAQKENDLTQEYEKLLASAQIPFEGKTYTVAQMSPFMNDPDDARRLSAWNAVGFWFKSHADEFDDLYDKLVHLRDTEGKKMGYEGYTTLGYYRMGRNCYTKEDVEKFRRSVVTYLVPLAEKIYKDQAKRLGVSYPMNFADKALMFRTGNPKPATDADGIVNHAKDFYHELSPETDRFFTAMRENEMMDLLAKEGKASGGYCEGVADYGLPFIFANFNGTQDDVETVTHEAGHAFACYLNADRVPVSTVWPSMEACEVHSMSMEFFAWPWAKGFFGKDTEKFYYSHLAGALTFIPYGTLVDHFQHVMYEKPYLTPAERHGVWRELSAVYTPWLKFDGEIPFYSDGCYWQRQHHIYSSPFYYIDYCLAQTVALQFWAMIQKDFKGAWEHYMAYTRLGGSMTFTDLLTSAGLRTPFDEACLREASQAAGRWLDAFDTSVLK